MAAPEGFVISFAIWFAAIYIGVDIMGHGVIAYLRRGCERVPFMSPTGQRWLIWNDPLATKLGGNNRSCTTILRTVGANERITRVGIQFDHLFHEDFHARWQWYAWGVVSAVLFLPAYLALCWLGKHSPFERIAYKRAEELRKRPTLDPEREAWVLCANEVERTRPK